jgi:hypothetical protein
MLDDVYTQNTRKIPSFLRELANKIENSELTETNMKSIGEFYMLYMFKNRGFNNKIIEEESVDGGGGDDYIKFVSLGWYIYTQCLNTE